MYNCNKWILVDNDDRWSGDDNDGDYFAPGGGVKYYDKRVCLFVCLSVCLFVCLSTHVSQKPHD